MSDSSDAIREWQALRRTLARDEFVARFPQPFLLVRQAPRPRPAPASAPGEATDRFEFDTGVVEPGQAPAVAPPPRLASGRIWRLVKGAQSPYRDYVTVGRAQNCDVVLLDPSVSKLHAYFRVAAAEPAALVDNGSKNGTCLNGKRLDPRASHPVAAGDVVLFGHVAAQFLDADLLYRML